MSDWLKLPVMKLCVLIEFCGKEKLHSPCNLFFYFSSYSVHWVILKNILTCPVNSAFSVVIHCSFVTCYHLLWWCHQESAVYIWFLQMTFWWHAVVHAQCGRYCPKASWDRWYWYPSRLQAGEETSFSSRWESRKYRSGSHKKRFENKKIVMFDYVIEKRRKITWSHWRGLRVTFKDNLYHYIWHISCRK